MANDGEKLKVVRGVELRKQPRAIQGLFAEIREKLQKAGVEKGQVFNNPEEENENQLRLDCRKLARVIEEHPILSKDHLLKEEVAFARRYLFSSLKSSMAMQNITHDPLAAAQEWGKRLDALAEAAPGNFKGMTMLFTSRYVGMLIGSSRQKNANINALVGILAHKAEGLDIGHIADLLSAVDPQIGEIDLPEFITLIDSKAKRVGTDTLEKLLVLVARARPADSQQIAVALESLISKRKIRLSDDHRRLLLNLGVRIE